MANESAPTTYRFRVSGRVQGVGFRYAARQSALRLNLVGWVCNRADGDVEGIVQGDPMMCRMFAKWLRQGPVAAQVEDCRWHQDADTSEIFTDFQIRRQGSAFCR